jgi:hypothetical protein
MRKLAYSLLALFAAVIVTSSAKANPLTEALKGGSARAMTTDEVAVRDAAPKQGTLLIDTGKKLVELPANTAVTITQQMELRTLLGPAIYVKLTAKHPQTGQDITGWAWYGDSKKSQFRLL